MKVIRHAFNSTLVLSYRRDPVSDKTNINSFLFFFNIP